jgi:glucose/arabinose dehydrogenase
VSGAGSIVRGSAALAAAVCAAALVACAPESKLAANDDKGPNPQLPQPVESLLPGLRIATPRAWGDARPVVPPDAAPSVRLKVEAFARGLDHPRWLFVLPQGDVLVAETNAPFRPLDALGLHGMAEHFVSWLVGAGGRSADRITRIAPDGKSRAVFLEHLHSPFGMALVDSDFYVADTDRILRYSYDAATRTVRGPAKVMTELPAGFRNHHWTKSLIAAPDGRHLYATVGSNSNIRDHGACAEEGRAAIYEVDRVTGARTVFASGIRNANGMAWEPKTGALWTVVNERDELGPDLAPDYLTRVRRGDFYGWPWFYWGKPDARVKVEAADRPAQPRVPDYALGNHVAALGLAYDDGHALGGALGPGMYIGEHGSWNRSPLSGYEVVFVPFADGEPSGLPRTVLTGFIGPDGHARGRPVGVAIDARGALLVADDVGNTIWRVSAEE